jgi:hypothetical protein
MSSINIGLNTVCWRSEDQTEFLSSIRRGLTWQPSCCIWSSRQPSSIGVNLKRLSSIDADVCAMWFVDNTRLITIRGRREAVCRCCAGRNLNCQEENVQRARSQAIRRVMNHARSTTTTCTPHPKIPPSMLSTVVARNSVHFQDFSSTKYSLVSTRMI